MWRKHPANDKKSKYLVSHVDSSDGSVWRADEQLRGFQKLWMLFHGILLVCLFLRAVFTNLAIALSAIS